MGKNRIQAIAVIFFGAFLMIPALTGGSMNQAELGRLQDAMRNLKRVNNLQMTYVYAVSEKGMTDSEQIKAWADMLSGDWVSEHYMTDEDGTRLYLKQFCDGRVVYICDDWGGDWEAAERTNSCEVPNLQMITMFPYANGDILEMKSEEKDGGRRIVCTFTPEYLRNEQEMWVAEMESVYASYQNRYVSDEILRTMELAAEQNRQMRFGDVAVTYMIDANRVLTGMEYTAALMMPEMGTDENGKSILDNEGEIQVLLMVSVDQYNKNEILDKIEQCECEVIE